MLTCPRSPVWVRGDAAAAGAPGAQPVRQRWTGPQRAAAAQVAGARLRPAECPGHLAVADSGPGVPEAERARIFDAFFSTKDGGMGMGLAICRSITEAHHGRIFVGQDESLGGALFTVQLPLAPPATAPAPRHDQRTARRGHPYRGRRRRRARRPGLAVRLARLPVTHLGQRRRVHRHGPPAPGRLGPGVVLLDVRMEPLSGPVTFEQLKALGCPWPVLFSPAMATSVRPWGVKNGAWDFLENPSRTTCWWTASNRPCRPPARQTDAGARGPAPAPGPGSLSPREREVLDS